MACLGWSDRIEAETALMSFWFWSFSPRNRRLVRPGRAPHAAVQRQHQRSVASDGHAGPVLPDPRRLRQLAAERGARRSLANQATAASTIVSYPSFQSKCPFGLRF